MEIGFINYTLAMKRMPTPISAYFKVQPSPQKETALEMRGRILEIIPEATEIIKYGMPTFEVDGQAICGLLVNKKHVGFYPYSGSVLAQFPDLLEKFVTTKGSLHVPVDKPLSKSILRQLIKARLVQLKSKK